MTLPGRDISPIGLDIGDRWIKAVQLGRGGRVLAAARFRRRGTELDDAQIARIESVLHRRGFTGRRVVLSAEPRSLTGAVITLPPASSGAPLDQIARAELARIARRDPAAVQVGWWPVPAPAGARQHECTHAMAAACPRAEIESIVARFEAAGLEVESIDAPAWALARGVGAMLRAEGAGSELRGVLDLGWNLATVVLLRDGAPIYERTLEELGVAALETQLREGLGVNEEVAAHTIERIGAPAARGVTSLTRGADPWAGEPDDGARAVGDFLARVAREVAASIVYLGHRYPSWSIAEIIGVGGGAMIPGACETIGAALGLPARTATWPGPADDDAASAARADFIQAAGLALYAPEVAE